MSVLQVIEQREILGKQLTMYGDFEEPLFLAKEVADWIENKQPTQMVELVDEDEKLKCIINTSGQNREMWFLTEDGLYEVLMQSRKPIAKQFKKEVKALLKNIRKGMFSERYINNAGIEQIIQRTVAETIQAVVPEVMKAVMNNMIPFLLGQQKAVTTVKAAVKENEPLENEKDYYTYETDVAFHLMGINKIELFPEEMLEQVNGIMEGMRREQKLNCNLIARFCKNLGYPVSKETVKEYFEKKFLKG